SDSDLSQILRHFEVNRSRFAADLTSSLDRLKSGNARTPSLSPSLVKMLSEAWTLGSLDFGAGQIRSGHTILALVASEELGRMVRGVSREFEKIAPEALQKDFAAIVAESPEEAVAASAPSAA